MLTLFLCHVRYISMASLVSCDVKPPGGLTTTMFDPDKQFILDKTAFRDWMANKGERVPLHKIHDWMGQYDGIKNRSLTTNVLNSAGSMSVVICNFVTKTITVSDISSMLPDKVYSF